MRLSCNQPGKFVLSSLPHYLAILIVSVLENFLLDKRTLAKNARTELDQ